MRSLIIALLLVPSLALAKPKPKKPVDDVQFYLGSIDVRSVDGTRPVSQGTALMKRTIAASRATITEELVKTSSTPGFPTKLSSSMLTLVRDGDSGTFTVSSADKSFTGTVTFPDKDSLVAWTYELKDDTGATLSGRARLVESGLETETLSSDATGKVKVMIKERLAPITRAEWQDQHKQMLRAP